VSQPILFAVDSDAGSLRAIERELVDRYDRSYRIVCVGSAPETEAELARMATVGEDVVLVLAGESLDGRRAAIASPSSRTKRAKTPVTSKKTIHVVLTAKKRH
jgi:hypothetical protein